MVKPLREVVVVPHYRPSPRRIRLGQADGVFLLVPGAEALELVPVPFEPPPDAPPPLGGGTARSGRRPCVLEGAENAPFGMRRDEVLNTLYTNIPFDAELSI